MAQRIAEEVIREVISANDIVELVSRYVTLKRSGSSMVGLCPFHKEKTPSFHVSPDRQLYYCFGCNAGGNIVEFVKNIENLDFVESIRFLAERAGINVDVSGFSEEDKRAYLKRQEILKVNRDVAHFFRDRLLSDEGKQAREYAVKRGIEPKTVNAFGLGYAPAQGKGVTGYLLAQGYSKNILIEAGISAVSEGGRIYDRFRDRLIFPIIDIRGNVIGFGGRIMGDGKVKYLNSPETMVFNKRKNLFSLNLAKNSGQNELILVEGYMDVVSLYQSGIKNAVASLGTALTQEQARLMTRFASGVVLCYDTDGAGVKATERALEIFDGLPLRVKVLSLPDGKDPDEYIKKYGAENFKKAIATAKTVPEYKISQLAKRFDLSDTGQRTEYAGECAKIIAGVQSEIEKEVLRSKVAEQTGITNEALGSEIKKMSGRRVRQEKKEAIKESVKISYSKRDGTSDAEKRLVSLCASDKTVYTKLKNEITADLFSDSLMPEILTYIDNGTPPEMIISSFPGREAEVAAALGMPQCYENNIKAAKEMIETILREKHELLVKKAIAEGDTEMLNKLIFGKGKSSEGGN